MQINSTFQKLSLSILLLGLRCVCFSQTTTVNIGLNAGLSDSTFVIQTGLTDSFSTQNHPGAGAYSNAEIYLCQNATLKYDYFFGTSSQPTFYLEEGATLILSQNAFANFYLKSTSTINGTGNTHYGYVSRYASSNLINMGASSLWDSVYTGITYTFSAWAGGQSPCNSVTNTTNQSNTISPFITTQNSISNELLIQMKDDLKFIEIEVYNSVGQVLMRKSISSASTTLQLNNYARGVIYYRIKDKHRVLQYGKMNIL